MPPGPAPLAVTCSHATALVEIDGYRLPHRPGVSERCSPSRAVGPSGCTPPVVLEALPALDAVVISHDHYDHRHGHRADAVAYPACGFVAPSGGRPPARVGIPASGSVELDWGSSYTLEDLHPHLHPARHFLRTLPVAQQHAVVVVGVHRAQHRAFFSRGHRLHQEFRRHRRPARPVRSHLLPVGAYNRSWPDIHMNPKRPFRAHGDLNAAAPGGMLVPIHWGTFRLAPHPGGTGRTTSRSRG